MPERYTATYRRIYETAWFAKMSKNTFVRDKIINDFSEWAAFSATRSGCPIKSRNDIYPLIRMPKYHSLFTGNEISAEEFDDWHKESSLSICKSKPVMPIGWATKLINIYLKAMVYLTGLGRPGLVKYIHPPIDNGLWAGIFTEYGHRPEIISKTHFVNRIKDINTYEKYMTIIHGCILIAKDRNCHLIEVEELWQGTKI
jgi:hypothetical protein